MWWTDGHVEADSETMRRLRQASERTDFDEVLTFLHTVEDAFGQRPRITVTDLGTDTSKPLHRPLRLGSTRFF